MTQSSIPQTGHVSDGLTPDAGPYSAPRWSEAWQSILTSHPDQGPIGLTGDTTLEVTNPLPSAATFNVDSGKAMVGGRLFDSTAQMVFSVTPPGGVVSRIDVVVVVQNESSTPVTTGILSGTPLQFPTDLTDYQGTPSIPPYSARLAILEGVEAASPVAPTLDQDRNLLYMIPLAQYEVDPGENITNFTDRRLYTVSAGGGAVYVPEYWYTVGGTPTQALYQGRARIIPMEVNFQFGSGPSTSIQWPAGENFGMDKYATFFHFSLNDFWAQTEWAAVLVFMAWHNGTPPNSYLELECYRNGYVDQGGNPQPVRTVADDINANFTLIQLLDTPPVTATGFGVIFNAADSPLP